MARPRLSNDLPPMITSHDAHQVTELARELLKAMHLDYENYKLTVESQLNLLGSSNKVLQQAILAAQPEWTRAQQDSFRLIVEGTRNFFHSLTDGANGYARLVERFGFGRDEQEAENTTQEARKHEPANGASAQKSRKTASHLNSVASMAARGATRLLEPESQRPVETSSVSQRPMRLCALWSGLLT